MTTSISIENFRSIEHAEVELAPLVALYGPTASGKSSLLYALLVVRNFVINPNRPADGYLHLGFMDLGGFDQCVFNHDGSRRISVGVRYVGKDGRVGGYKLSFSKDKGTVQQRWHQLVLEAEVPIPYGLNLTFPFSYAEDGEEYTINWNGISGSVSPRNPTQSTQQRAREIAETLNAGAETLKAIDVAPHHRGFFKPNYTSVPVSPTPTTEDEVASLIINDPNLAPKISVYAEEIFGRDFRLYVPPGTATVFFQTTDKKSRTPGLLVNDGFGVNQVIYLLAKILRSGSGVILIEEPEIHLHPTVLRSFVRQLGLIAREEKKQIIFTTHSEVLVSSLLRAVADGVLAADEVRCYLCSKAGRTSNFMAQRVQPNGQIEGGLGSFVEAELEDLKKLLGI